MHASHRSAAEPDTYLVVQSFLPSQTPRGVQRLRDMDLKAKRGDGHGERMPWQPGADAQGGLGGLQPP